MIVGIGVTFMIMGILAYVVADTFKPNCAQWKKRLIDAFILFGAVLTIAGYLV